MTAREQLKKAGEEFRAADVAVWAHLDESYWNTLRRIARWMWAAQAAWWFLGKAKAIHPHFDKSQMVKSILIDRNKATSKIVELATHQLRAMNGKRPERILLGLPQFQSLHTETDFMWRSFSFPIQLAERVQSGHLGRYETHLRLFDVSVEVIPWMDGVLVL